MSTLPAEAIPSAKQQCTIRRCRTMHELDQCIALQQQVWGYPDRELVPRNIFVLAEALGGHVLGAFDESGALAGFVMAVAAHEPSRHAGEPPRPYFHSHMLAVAPAFRNRGLGLRLKRAQREDALARGITLIRWTFDPLIAKNAYFNLQRLGAAAIRFLPDFYGPLQSALQGGLPSDRLLVEWPLLSSLSDARSAPAPTRTIALPAAVERWKAEGRRDSLAAAQAELRAQFTEAFTAGMQVCGFRLRSDKSGEYLLSLVSSKNATQYIPNQQSPS